MDFRTFKEKKVKEEGHLVFTWFNLPACLEALGNKGDPYNTSGFEPPEKVITKIC